MAIKVGYEVGERGVHTIQRTGCAALVTEVTANPDGTFEIMVIGRRRFHVESLDPTQDYLRADVEWLPDASGGDTPATPTRRRSGRASCSRSIATPSPSSAATTSSTARRRPTRSTSRYTLAAALVLNLAERQALLEAPDVVTRLRLGTSLMRAELQAMSAIPSLPATTMARTQWSPN